MELKLNETQTRAYVNLKTFLSSDNSKFLLLGPAGSGKTTVGLLLMRLHQASGGQAFIEGKDIIMFWI